MKDVLLVMLGSVLALATSFLTERSSKRSLEKRLRQNFKTVLRLELKHTQSIITKLNDGFNNVKFFQYSIIDQLDTNLKRLENIRKDAIYLKEESKKEEILNCINDVFEFASDIRGIENYAWDKKNGEDTEDAKKNKLDFCLQQRQINILKTIDLRRRIQDIVNLCENINK